MWRTILTALIASALAAQVPSLSISGVVADKLGPLPDVRVIVTGSGRYRTHTDETGRYRFDGLRAGDYRVLAAIAGFRSKWRDITLREDAVVDFELSPGDIVAVDFAPLDPQSAYREADVIAHLRIEGSLPPQPCRRTPFITHEATVLDTIKGSLPSSILIDQIGAGMCLKDDGFEFAGADRPWTPREEYIAFMRRDGDRFASLRGPLLIFKVGNGVVETRQYGDLPATLPLTEFYAAVRRMGQ